MVTQADELRAGVLAFSCTIPGTIICGLVLVAYGVTALSPITRKSFDRVSFRLLVYSLIANVLFGAAYTATPTSPGVGCKVAAFSVNLTLMFATYFTTCIAVNLMLVLAFGCDGNKLEKYYIIMTTVISLALNIPAVALGQFGWNESDSTCWYSNANKELRLRWLIATQSFWIALAVAIEAICSFYVIIWLLRVSRQLSFRTPFSRATPEKSMRQPGVSLLNRDPRYKRIIFRIALYPIVSLFMNFSTVVLDLNTSIVGDDTELEYRLLLLDLSLYGLRTLAYGVLASTDPSFISAIREIRKSRKSSSEADDNSRTFNNIHFASASTRPPTETVISSLSGNVKGKGTLSLLQSSGTNEDLKSNVISDNIESAEPQEDVDQIARQL